MESTIDGVKRAASCPSSTSGSLSSTTGGLDLRAHFGHAVDLVSATPGATGPTQGRKRQRAPSPATPMTKSHTQTFLDLGQRSLGRSECRCDDPVPPPPCPAQPSPAQLGPTSSRAPARHFTPCHLATSVCGMLYARGVEEDERDHRAHCNQFSRGVAFPGWTEERELCSDSAEGLRCAHPRT